MQKLGPEQWMLTSFGILTAALTALATTNGTVEHVERNNPKVFWIGVVLVVCCIGFALIGMLVPKAAYWSVSPKACAAFAVAVVATGTGMVGATMSAPWWYVVAGILIGVAAVVGVVAFARPIGLAFNSLWRWALASLAIAGVSLIVGHALTSASPSPYAWVGATLAAVGAVLYVLAARVWSRNAYPVHLRTALFSTGVVSFVTGLAYVSGAVIFTATLPQEPRISASLKVGPPLEFDATVRASGVTSDQHVEILVQGVGEPLRNRLGHLVYVKQGDNKHLVFDQVPIYQSSLGPDASGDVDTVLALPLSPSRPFDSVQIRAWVSDARENPPSKCYTPTQVRHHPHSTGCLTLRIPWVSQLPTLSATIHGAEAGRTVTVDVAAANLPVSAVDSTTRQIEGTDPTTLEVLEHPSLVRVVVTRQRRRRPVTLFAGVFPPDALGRVSRVITIPVTSDVRQVCVAAETETLAARNTFARFRRHRLFCPRRPKQYHAGVVWERIAIPRA